MSGPTKTSQVKDFSRWASACVAADGSGVTSVSTGLRSPVYGIAMPKTSGARNLRGVFGNYYTATGSTLLFQWFSGQWLAGSVLAVLSSSIINFNWIAFEA